MVGIAGSTILVPFHVCSQVSATHLILGHPSVNYRKVSNIRRTKYQNLNDPRLVLQLSVPNPLKPSVKSIMKM